VRDREREEKQGRGCSDKYYTYCYGKGVCGWCVRKFVAQKVARIFPLVLLPNIVWFIKFISYRAVNTLRLGYKIQSVNAV
jgi:hypothetical protein